MNICVFCGSSAGTSTLYAETARKLGFLMAGNGHQLIYGGGNIGLMGIVADSVLAHGGEVTGIIPDFLMKKEVGHSGLTHLEVVKSMHERKRRMADLADAFVVFPGGWGTLDETAEILTWRQLELITQPIGLINVAGFFNLLLGQMQHMVKEGFLKPDYLSDVIVAETAEQLLASLS